MIGEDAPYRDPFEIVERRHMDMFEGGAIIVEKDFFKQEIRAMFGTVGNGDIKDAACFGLMQNGMNNERRQELAKFFNDQWNTDIEGVEDKEEAIILYYRYIEEYDFRLAIDKKPKKCGEKWLPIGP